MPGEGVRWKARISRNPDKWHRVEVEGAHETEPPVALVKDPQLVVAIAALPLVADALREISEGRGTFSLDHLTHATNTIAEMKALAVAALAAMEGR